eukprot:900588-Lingulodinium_polyedra.AAC.1
MPIAPTGTLAAETSSPVASRFTFSAPGRRRANGAGSGLAKTRRSGAATPTPGPGANGSATFR